MTTSNHIHVYQQRHIFKGDDHIGKYDVTTRQIRLATDFGGLKDEVKAYYMRTHGIPATVLVGDEEVKSAAPLVEFPHEIREQMSPQLGDLSPAAIQYARQHFTAREFNRRYRGRQPELPESTETTPAPAPPEPPDVPTTTPTTTPTATPTANALGLPIGAPDDYNGLVAYLKEKGLTVPRNMKKAAAVELYLKHMEKAKEDGVNGFADRLYETYCAAVGGVAFNGDPLPTWPDFRADPDKEKQSNAWLMTSEMLLSGRSAITTPEETAEHIYTSYCTAVGGVAFNGDPLPTWTEFRADPAKEKQSNAWVMTAELAIKLLS